MTPKTYKRETALGMLAFLAVLAVMAVFRPAEAMPVLEVLVYPILAFAGMAFGLDSYAKQIRR